MHSLNVNYMLRSQNASSIILSSGRFMDACLDIAFVGVDLALLGMAAPLKGAEIIIETSNKTLMVATKESSKAATKQAAKEAAKIATTQTAKEVGKLMSQHNVKEAAKQTVVQAAKKSLNKQLWKQRKMLLNKYLDRH